jgi:hypothetical protein
MEAFLMEYVKMTRGEIRGIAVRQIAMYQNDKNPQRLDLAYLLLNLAGYPEYKAGTENGK